MTYSIDKAAGMDILFEDKQITLSAGQTVLSALLDHGYDIPNSCRAGLCQSCLMQAVDGQVPDDAQQGLKDTLKAQGYFLACSCQPIGPMVVTLPAANSLRQTVSVLEHTLLNHDVVRLRMKAENDFGYRAGQYTTLWHPDNIGRSYSFASTPQLDDYLEFHVRRVDGGQVSSWLFDSVKVGDSLQIQSAAGDSFYLPGKPEQRLILAATGTGLSPLIGIARDALQQGHQGDIHLFHGATNMDGLYLHQDLLDMAQQHKQFHYHASVLDIDNIHSNVSTAPVEKLVLTVAPNLAECKIHLCGAPDLVNSLKKKLFLSGASISNIYTDPFIMTPVI
ncbi:MAG: 2Fe-2S iron-sulfur cluster-binding protein [Gammaproteobacteria bacterium]